MSVVPGRLAWRLFAGALLALACAPAAFAQSPSGRSQPLITQAVDAGNLVVLSGNTRPEAKNAANDRGPVADNFVLPTMMLQLRRPAGQEQALNALISQLTDPNSPNYHHWLTPQQLGAQFGPAQSDIEAIIGWLRQQGFAVVGVYPNRMAITFSGTAGRVRSAFRTEIHNVNVSGANRFANMSDPQIPAALAPAVAGVTGLNNIPPKKQVRARKQYSAGGFEYLVVPADLATIYNLNPVFSGGNTGQGQTIYLWEDTDLYSTSDWSTFRSRLGLSGYTGASLTTIHPGCTDPGVNSDDDEAILDAEWASAAAPSAAIVMAACSDLVTALNTMFGNTATYPPSIISISYGECEANVGSYNSSINSAYQTGAAEGWSIFVAAGDWGAALCDAGTDDAAAKFGVAVSGWASTPYNVAVGGTDFSDAYSATQSTYWNSSNGSTYGSAKSYIPEIPWNDSCASQLIANVYGYSATYGASGFCNSSDGAAFINIAAGSGGPSTIYSKPSWQSGFIGIVSDGVRDLPDVSLFAANGVWGHYYVFCFSDPDNAGDPGDGCSGAPNTWNGAGGTSFASPIWAGFQALINNKQGAAQGLPNPRLYALARTEYGSSGSSTCNSSNGNTIGSSCVFNDVTLGDMDVPCFDGDPNCYDPDGSKYGVLSTSTGAYQPAYTTAAGWDFATGIGTVNVYNLVNAWATALEAPLTVSVTGSGTVTSSPSGIDCPSACSANFSTGTPVTLTPAAAGGWVFTGWSGACSGNGGCTVTMNSSQSVVATFKQLFTLTVSDSGSGTVTSSPAGINCGSTCNASFASGTQVTLTPMPAPGWQFTSWSGACSGSGSCVVTMNAAASVTATFTQLYYALSVFVSGYGTVTSSPSGISCPSICSARFLSESSVTLSAAPGAGATFSGWSGACSGTGSCMVTMSAAENVSATFTANGGGGLLNHTWVASTGSNNSQCSVTAPCLTFAEAIAVTSPGGEINCLDAGDFGTVTIGQAVTINCEAVSNGGITASGVNAITVNATGAVNLIGLDINGLNVAGGNGVYIESNGAVNIRTCKIHDFPIGQTSTGIAIWFIPSAAGGSLVVDKVFVANNSYGIIENSGASISNMSVRNSIIDNNSVGIAVQMNGGTHAGATIEQTTLAFNLYGLYVNGSGAIALIGGSTLVNNGTGVIAGSGGVAYSFKNNKIGGNSTDGTPLTAYPGGPLN